MAKPAHNEFGEIDDRPPRWLPTPEEISAEARAIRAEHEAGFMTETVSVGGTLVRSVRKRAHPLPDVEPQAVECRPHTYHGPGR